MVIQVWIVEDSFPRSRVSATTVEVLQNKLGKVLNVRACPSPPDITGIQAGLTSKSNRGT